VALSIEVMGIINVTPDSFFPASRSLAADDAVARGTAMFEAGCDVVDVGGESTRPCAVPVEPDEELARILPVVAALEPLGRVSIDTQKAVVARAALDAGARIVNDVSCTLIDVAGDAGADYVAMHRQGDSTTMQVNPHYDDVITEVLDFLRDAATRARRAGVGRLWLDPGIGFGKTVEHNLSLLAHVDRLVALAEEFDAGVLIGTSRKRFLERLGHTALDVDQRLEGSIASEAWVMLEGVSMVRVHDVASALQLRELLARPVEGVDA
jgi:dihydropteroate synthase